ncbi:MAG: hypothetical protein QXI33_03610 [Candidatus Pacearchaeota archaeon]
MLKRGGIFWAIVIIIFIFAIVDVYLLYDKYYLSKNKENKKNNFGDKPPDNWDNLIVLDNGTIIAVNSSVGNHGEGGSTRNEIGESETPSSPSCNTQISYSLESLMVSQVCQTWSNEVCTEKYINCSLDVYNFDKEISGLFEVQFSISDEDRENTPISLTKSDIIGTNAFKRFVVETTLTSTEQNGIANKNLICSFQTLKVPKKNIC